MTFIRMLHNLLGARLSTQARTHLVILRTSGWHFYEELLKWSKLNFILIRVLLQHLLTCNTQHNGLVWSPLKPLFKSTPALPYAAALWVKIIGQHYSRWVKGRIDRGEEEWMAEVKGEEGGVKGNSDKCLHIWLWWLLLSISCRLTTKWRAENRIECLQLCWISFLLIIRNNKKRNSKKGSVAGGTSTDW